MSYFNSGIILIRILLIIGFLNSVSSQAQYLNGHEEKGYIILPTNDTISGYISFIREKELYQAIKFRKNKKEDYKSFNSENLNYFFFEDEGELFVSKRILQVQHPTVDSIASDSFVKVLTRGAASLYSYSIGGKTKYLVSDGTTISPLNKGSNQSKSIDGKLYTSGNKPYQKTLKRLFSKCTSISPTLKYSIYDFNSVITSYNDCLKSPYKQFKTRKSKTLIGFNLGYLSSQLEFKDKGAILKPYGYSNSAPEGSYDLDFLLNEKVTSSAFSFGLSVTTLVKDNKHFYFNTNINYVTRKWRFDFFNTTINYFDIPASINYNFGLESGIQPKIGIGVNLALPVSKKLESPEVDWEFYRTSWSLTWPSMLPVNMPVIFTDQFKPTMLSPFINLGVDIKNGKSMLSVTFSQGLPSSITSSSIYKTSVSYQMVTLNYSFLTTEKSTN